MKCCNRVSKSIFVYFFILLALSISSCDKTQLQSADGIDDFKSIAQQTLTKLENGEITRNEGFYTECALDVKRDKGIRISESVCDKENFRSITIRITDPTSRPPSQKIKTIQLSTESGDIITASRGGIKTTSKGITIKFDRSGQSIIFEWQLEKQS